MLAINLFAFNSSLSVLKLMFFPFWHLEIREVHTQQMEVYRNDQCFETESASLSIDQLKHITCSELGSGGALAKGPMVLSIIYSDSVAIAGL